MSLLGYSETDVWEMTLAKIATLYSEYKKHHDNEFRMSSRGLTYDDLKTLEKTKNEEETIIAF